VAHGLQNSKQQKQRREKEMIKQYATKKDIILGEAKLNGMNIFLLVLVVIVLTLWHNGCQNLSPANPPVQEKSETIPTFPAELAVLGLVAQKTRQKQFTTASKYINKYAGGTVFLDHNPLFYMNDPIFSPRQFVHISPTSAVLFTSPSSLSPLSPKRNGYTLPEYAANTRSGIRARVSLTIPPDSMSQHARISLTLDDQECCGKFDILFAPHGTTFKKPALLNISATGLELSGENPDSWGLYYINNQSGEWEPMDKEEMYVDMESGTLVVKNARLPHFSRYTIGEIYM
jgi:hypothetical protein